MLRLNPNLPIPFEPNSSIKSTAGVPSERIQSDIDSMLKDLGLSQKAGSFPRELSGGMQRKLCVAIAFMGHSSVVLLVCLSSFPLLLMWLHVWTYPEIQTYRTGSDSAS